MRSLVVCMLCMALAMPALTQAPPAVSTSPLATTSGTEAKSFAQQELDQLLAPVALYPDALLAQVLMASTYPLEIVYAERWIKAYPNLKGAALEDALQSQRWDPAVKSLTVLPQVLTMMSEKLDWTQKLGDAFLAQQQDVMATVQALRRKAIDQGTLKDSKEQRVIIVTENNVTIIKIESVEPEVVYVPVYDPAVVYGAWPYPAYPPYYWYPPGYPYPPGLWFGAGIIIGWALWGDCNWGNGRVYVDHRRYNNFNRSNISGDNTWRHNVDHRGAVPYRDRKVADQYGRGRSVDAASRDAFRGRADVGRQPTQRGDFGGRDPTGTRSPTAFDTGGRAQTRDYSSRGSSSMGSARSSGSFGGGMRGGGGGRGGGRR